MNSEALRCVY